MRALRYFAEATLLLASFDAAVASETVSYTYDARGRLIQVQHAGSVNNGLVTTYSFDQADNRSNKTTSSPPPGTVSFAVFDSSAVEGGSLSFTVTLTGVALTSHSVNYATANGTASSNDYSAASGMLTFALGETSKTVTVATTNNSLAESEETVLLNLSGATGGATISDAQAVGTITDNDIPGGGSDCYTDPLGQLVCQ